MILLDEITALIDDRISKTGDKSVARKVLTDLRFNINQLIQKDADSRREEQVENKCGVCGKESTNLKQGKYCLSCFDMLVD